MNEQTILQNMEDLHTKLSKNCLKQSIVDEYIEKSNKNY
jgi:hypothetical protein